MSWRLTEMALCVGLAMVTLYAVLTGPLLLAALPALCGVMLAASRHLEGQAIRRRQEDALGRRRHTQRLGKTYRVFEYSRTEFPSAPGAILPLALVSAPALVPTTPFLIDTAAHEGLLAAGAVLDVTILKRVEQQSPQ